MALVLTMCSAFSLKKDHSKTVYAFGIAASFTDTVVYFTDIQILDSAKVSKEGFLTHRDLYFSENRKKLEKEATKILSKYKRNRNTTVTRIDTDKFHFIKPEE